MGVDSRANPAKHGNAPRLATEGVNPTGVTAPDRTELLPAVHMTPARAGQAGGVRMPFYAHRLDLPEAYQAADRMGRLVVVGKLDWPDVDRFAHRWAVMAHQVTGVDALGAETRFCWASWDGFAAAENERSETVRAIKAMLRPLIAERRPWNVLMAEAHEVNGVNGFPLAEDEVSEIVRTEVHFALPPAPRGRHG